MPWQLRESYGFYRDQGIIEGLAAHEAKIDKLAARYANQKTTKVAIYKCKEAELVGKFVDKSNPHVIPYMSMFKNGEEYQFDPAPRTIPEIRSAVSEALRL